MSPLEEIVLGQIQAIRGLAKDPSVRRRRWHGEVQITLPASALDAVADTLAALLLERQRRGSHGRGD